MVVGVESNLGQFCCCFVVIISMVVGVESNLGLEIITTKQQQN
jgi:hypothetical protein